MQIIGAPLAAGLLYLDGRGGLHGWQWIFIGAPPCSALCLVEQSDPTAPHCFHEHASQHMQARSKGNVLRFKTGTMTGGVLQHEVKCCYSTQKPRCRVLVWQQPQE